MYRVDLTRLVTDLEHGNAIAPGHAVVAALTARQGSGDSIEKTEEANASV